jgi:hypothetical protein
MAEQSVHDVVNQTLSVGDYSPSDANEDQSIRHSTGGDIASGESKTGSHEGRASYQDGQIFQTGSASFPMVNGQAHVRQAGLSSSLAYSDSVHEQVDSGTLQQDSDFDGNLSRNQSVGDLSAASDTDARKVEQLSTSEDTKNQDAINAAKRPASFKPVSFAKYSAAKVVGINSAAKSNADKGE